MDITRRHCLVWSAAATWPMARATDARQWAALSLIGGELTVITLQGSTGSHTDTSEREKLVLPGSALDEPALKAVEAVLVAQRIAPPLLLVPGGKAFYEGQAAMLEGGRFAPNAALRPVLEQIQGQATHLLVLTRQRSGGGLRGVRLPSGPRSLEGLGFCLDAGWRERAGGLVVEGSGLLAPYAAFRASVVELKSGAVLRSEAVNASSLMRTPPGHTNPWAALDDAAKMAGLNALVKGELERVLPGLLG